MSLLSGRSLCSLLFFSWVLPAVPVCGQANTHVDAGDICSPSAQTQGHTVGIPLVCFSGIVPIYFTDYVRRPVTNAIMLQWRRKISRYFN